MEYRIVAVERAGEWQARAERIEGGDQFGIECRGATQAEAVARLTTWLAWQQAHVGALHALQEAERAYHRSVGSAFAAAGDGPAVERREALAVLDRARTALDAIRAKRPETS